jgi:hypothetical protein
MMDGPRVLSFPRRYQGRAAGIPAAVELTGAPKSATQSSKPNRIGLHDAYSIANLGGGYSPEIGVEGGRPRRMAAPPWTICTGEQLGSPGRPSSPNTAADTSPVMG